jgi:hypothetical protein
MKKSFLYRVHEWLADNVKWVQYPNISTRTRPLFRNAMPWSTRALLTLLGSLALPLCGLALFFLGLFAWAALTA